MVDGLERCTGSWKRTEGSPGCRMPFCRDEAGVSVSKGRNAHP